MDGAQDARALTLVSVTYRAEDVLQQIQARSVAAHAGRADIRELIVIDNGSPALTGSRLTRMHEAFGEAAARVRFVPSAEVTALPATSGWIGQQVLKLAISSAVTTPHYVLLDAKNHFIRPVTASDFLSADGRARAGLHSYEKHPLLPKLRTTLGYLGLEVEPAVTRFPRTATPFVMNTEVARAVVDDVGHGSVARFAHEFVDNDLSEFFLYSGWLLRERGWATYLDPDPIQAPTIWGGAADLAGVRRAIEQARRTDAPAFGVHRRALRRLPRAARAELADFWIERGIVGDRRETAALRRRFLLEWTAQAARTRLPRRAAS